MIKPSLIILVTLLLSLNIFAQKPNVDAIEDYSGTWILDNDKSDFNPKLKEKFSDFTVVIKSAGPEINIEDSYSFDGKPSSRTVVLWIDKRGENNKYMFLRVWEKPLNFEDRYWIEDIEMKSKSSFKNGRITRDGSFTHNKMTYPTVVKETYSLSKDKKQLTIKREETQVTTENSDTLSSGTGYRSFIFRRK